MPDFMICVVTHGRLKAAGRLLRIWIKKGYRFEIMPARSSKNIGEVFYMERDLG